MRLLLVESDSSLGTFLKRGFAAENYETELTSSGADARRLASQIEFDAAILDVTVNDPAALVLLRELRAVRAHVPILVLAVRTGPEERAQMLDLGADDIVLKPFAFSELCARVRALLRRGARLPETALRIEDLELNLVQHKARRAGRPLDLTPKEFALLEYLMRNTGKHVTRTEIIQHVWNLSFDTMTNVVDVYINYLRKKVDSFTEHKLIHTVRGVGYCLQMQRPAEPQRIETCRVASEAS